MGTLCPPRLESLRSNYTLMPNLGSQLNDAIYSAALTYNQQIDNILTELRLLNKELMNMSTEMDNLTAQVHANSDLLDSAVTLINGIANRITAAGVDPVALDALTTELKAKDEALAASVAANTPASPATPA